MNAEIREDHEPLTREEAEVAAKQWLRPTCVRDYRFLLEQIAVLDPYGPDSDDGVTMQQLSHHLFGQMSAATIGRRLLEMQMAGTLTGIKMGRSMRFWPRFVDLLEGIEQ